MVETEWLYSEIRERFGDKPLRAEVWEWLNDNTWEVLKHMFPGCEDLLESVSEDIYYDLADELIVEDYDNCALAQELIKQEFDLQGEDEEENEEEDE